MISKEALLATINAMPDQISLDELVEKLLLLEKIGAALEQSDKNQVLSTKEARQHLEKWLR